MSIYPKGYCMIANKNGLKYADHNAAKLVNQDMKPITHYVKERIDEVITYVISNFTNVNCMCLSNLLEYYMYNFYGTLTNEILKYITDRTNDLVEQGVILEW